MTLPPKVADNSRATWSDCAREPFRIFFPLAVLAGMAGVALWPLHFWGWVPWYPGQLHARLMAYGLFGGFILGFLGTAMPRMLSAQPLKLVEVTGLAALYMGMATSYATGRSAAGDILLISLLTAFAACMGSRARRRADTPPPGFVLVGLSFLCVVSGAVLSIAADFREVDLFWVNLQHLLSYQGFVLLPILGIGPFILPRFFGLQSSHDFPEMLVPEGRWTRKALLSAGAGALIIGSFFLEAGAWVRSAYAVRFLTVVLYSYCEMPLHCAPKAGSSLGGSIRIAFLSLAGGFLAICIFPQFRVSLLHLTLIGGFAVITFIVATRVVFGHSGNIERLKAPNRWVWVSVGTMLFAMATRVSGDFWPQIMASHYIYGALLWIASVAIWAVYVLPKVRIADHSE